MGKQTFSELEKASELEQQYTPFSSHYGLLFIVILVNPSSFMHFKYCGICSSLLLLHFSECCGDIAGVIMLCSIADHRSYSSVAFPLILIPKYYCEKYISETIGACIYKIFQNTKKKYHACGLYWRRKSLQS